MIITFYQNEEFAFDLMTKSHGSRVKGHEFETTK